MAVKTKNIYEPVESTDGCRVLVMRFWPRGVSKNKDDLVHRAKKETVTLLCGCQDDKHCHRTLLAQLIQKNDSHNRSRRKYLHLT